MSNACNFINVAEVDTLLSGHMKTFNIHGRPVVLVNVEGEFFAFADFCLHWGVRLSDGCLQGHVVRCKAHGWNHDFVKGEVIASDPPGDEGRRMITFETKLLEGAIWVSTVPKKAG
jgi:nitrite reductase/ring-hydroxylating ferredoxin subunit